MENKNNSRLASKGKKILMVATIATISSMATYALADRHDKDDRHKHRKGGGSFKSMSISDKQKVFAVIDTNKNGKISLEEYKAGKDKVMFSFRDNNGDKELDMAEFFKRGKRF